MCLNLKPAVSCVSRVLLLLLVLLGAPTVRANPLPAQMMWVHVHPWDSQFCAQNPITQCEQIQQYSTATGDVEFDLFVEQAMPEPFELQQVHLYAVWPENWQFTGFESCSGGTLEIFPYFDHVVVDLTYEPSIGIEYGPVFLVGRLRMQVGGFGRLDFFQATLNGNAVGISKPLAGVDQCYCYFDCSRYGPACGAGMTPSVLVFELPQGESAQGNIHAYIREDAHWNPCPVQFTENEPWMDLTVLHQGPWEANVAVAVNTTGLPVGVYEGPVLAETACHDCVTVVLTVTPPGTGVPEQDPSVGLGSWGRIKSTFR